MRESFAEYLARTRSEQPAPDASSEVLLAEPFDDPTPDPALSVDVDHYLYGAPRRRPS